ncbi:hypothetical protein DICA3_F38688 [Diutina catenulata]
MKLKAVIFSCFAVSAALSITEDTDNAFSIDGGYLLVKDKTEPVSVAPGVNWNVCNLKQIRFSDFSIGQGGSVQIMGTPKSNLGITNANELQNPSGLFKNDGQLSACSSKTISFRGPFKNIENNGDLTIHSGDSLNFDIRGFESWVNRGTLSLSGDVFHVLYNNLGTSTHVQVSNGSIENSGDICLNNVKVKGVTTAKGTGCVHINGNAIFLGVEDQHDQTIQFGPGSTGYLGWVKNNMTIRGFGEGMELSGISQNFVYEGRFIRYTHEWYKTSVIIDLGPGYDRDLFVHEYGQLENGLVLKYRGPVPEGAAIAEECGVCPPLEFKTPSCAVSSSSTTSTSSTSSSGSSIQITSTSEDFATTKSQSPTESTEIPDEDADTRHSTETSLNSSEPTTSDETETTTPTPTTSNETNPNLPGPTTTERTTESSLESMWSPLPSDTRPTCDIHASTTVTAPAVTVTVYV